jgi:hypothetical protein
VVRGGAWSNNQNNARCAYRNRNNPNNRNNNIGLRLVSHILLPCRQCHGSALGRMRGRGTKKWCGLSAPRVGQFPWETSQRDAWPVRCGMTTGIGRISNSHAPSGSSKSEGWGVALYLGAFFKLNM